VADPDILSCLVGDRAACDRLAERYRPLIVQAAERTLARHDRTSAASGAEDVAQDVFVKLFRDEGRLLRSFDPARASFATWLAVLARSAAFDALRRRRSHPSIECRAMDIEAPEAAAAPEPVAIPDGLLSGRQRLILEMIFAKGMEVADIAAALGIDPQTVRSAKHKGLTALRAHFGGDV
jgi:RNA polymerase sigma factor (sigma-70 family)